MILAIIAIIISGVALGVSYAAIQRSNKRYEQQQRHMFCIDCRLTCCIYINQLHHYVEQLINDRRYEDAAKVKLIIQKEEAAAHEIFGLNF